MARRLLRRDQAEHFVGAQRNVLLLSSRCGHIHYSKSKELVGIFYVKMNGGRKPTRVYFKGLPVHLYIKGSFFFILRASLSNPRVSSAAELDCAELCKPLCGSGSSAPTLSRPDRWPSAVESSSKLARPAHSDTMHETCEASLQLDCRATLLLVPGPLPARGFTLSLGESEVCPSSYLALRRVYGLFARGAGSPRHACCHARCECAPGCERPSLTWRGRCCGECGGLW